MEEKAEEIPIEIPYRLTPFVADPTDGTPCVSFSFPPAAEAIQSNSHQLSAVFYNREFSFFNF